MSSSWEAAIEALEQAFGTKALDVAWAGFGPVASLRITPDPSLRLESVTSRAPDSGEVRTDLLLVGERGKPVLFFGRDVKDARLLAWLEKYWAWQNEHVDGGLARRAPPPFTVRGMVMTAQEAGLSCFPIIDETLFLLRATTQRQLEARWLLIADWLGEESAPPARKPARTPKATTRARRSRK